MNQHRNSEGFAPNSAIALGAAPCNECAAPATAGHVTAAGASAPACNDHVDTVRRVLALQAKL